MSQPTVVFSDDNKTVTIIGVNGDRFTRHAGSTLNVSFRKDGGVTVWADGEHKSQTLRVDAYGRLTDKARRDVLSLVA